MARDRHLLLPRCYRSRAVVVLWICHEVYLTPKEGHVTYLWTSEISATVCGYHVVLREFPSATSEACLEISVSIVRNILHMSFLSG